MVRAVAPPGRLVLGLTPLAWTAPVAGALAGLRAGTGRLDVRVIVAGRERIVAAAATGEIDLGLVDGFAAPSDPLRLPEPGSAGATGIGGGPAVVAMPAAHPLAGRAALDLADLADAYWIDAPEVTPAGDGLRAALRYDGTDVTALTGLIAAGHGLALLPAAVAEAAPQVVGVPVGTPRLVHRIESLGTPALGEPAARLAHLLRG